MPVNGGRLPSYDRQGRPGDTCVWACIRRWNALTMPCQGVFWSILDLGVPSARHSLEVEYARRKCEMLRTNISSESDVLTSSRCWLSRPFSLLYLKQKMEIWVETWTWKCDRGRIVCSSVGTISRVVCGTAGKASACLCGNAGVLAWLEECLTFLRLRRNASFASRSYWPKRIHHWQIKCSVRRFRSPWLWRSVHSFEKFAMAFYQGMVVERCSKTMIT